LWGLCTIGSNLGDQIGLIFASCAIVYAVFLITQVAYILGLSFSKVQVTYVLILTKY
jgi:hypothetical protein